MKRESSLRYPAPLQSAVFLPAFNLLMLDGKYLRREPIEVRKAALGKLLRGAVPAFN